MNRISATTKVKMARSNLMEGLKEWRDDPDFPALTNEYKAIQVLDALLKEMRDAR